MEEKVVNFHFLLAYLSSQSDPVFGDPCAHDGDEDLKEGAAQERLALLVSDALKDDRSQDADARDGDGDGDGDGDHDGDEAVEPQLFFLSSQIYIFTKVFIFQGLERAVSTFIFTVNSLNGFFYIWES